MNFTSFFLLVYLFTTFELKVLDKFLMTTKAQLGSLKILLPDLFNAMTLLKIKYFLLHRKMSSHHKKKKPKENYFSLLCCFQSICIPLLLYIRRQEKKRHEHFAESLFFSNIFRFHTFHTCFGDCCKSLNNGAIQGNK